MNDITSNPDRIAVLDYPTHLAMLMATFLASVDRLDALVEACPVIDKEPYGGMKLPLIAVDECPLPIRKRTQPERISVSMVPVLIWMPGHLGRGLGETCSRCWVRLRERAFPRVIHLRSPWRELCGRGLPPPRRPYRKSP